ncbi:MAG: WGR domain-containing protein [Sandaracinaceae bacterium]|nr:WGR domain-containing protein [Sandaracinaceae bacterium]
MQTVAPETAKESAQSAQHGTESATRAFELADGKSSKFWEITLSGNDVTTRWGRIGTVGQSTTKTYDTPERAQTEHDKLVAEKTKKGYVERPA